MSVRTFIAVDLPDSVKRHLAGIRENLSKIDAEVRWVRTEAVHLTLKFLGDVNEDNLNDVFDVVAKSAASLKPANMSTGTIGGFPNLKRPRVIWLGVEGEIEPIIEIANSLNENFRTLGFSAEKRDYHPHLTLGRVKGLKGIQSVIREIESYSLEPVAFKAENISVIKSELRPDGARYEKLFSLTLN